MGQYGNIEKMISSTLSSWREGADSGLMHIKTWKTDSNKLKNSEEHQFINMSSCSYLGLNRHPAILKGATDAIEREGVLNHSVSKVRIAPALLDEAEDIMSELFECEAMLGSSCFHVSATLLPLLSSGHLSNGVKPVMVFDKHCHFSMSIMKAVCGDETQVITIEHNDMDTLEQLCKTHRAVAYVCDGAYSLGGTAPMVDLIQLQNRYGLYLYADDSHAVSVYGKQGQGFVRPYYETLGERTFIGASLAKSFGALGGVLLVNSKKQREMVDYSAGPFGWSQAFSVPGMGAVKASALLHMTNEVAVLQEKMRSNMEYFDSLIPTQYMGNQLPIRVVEIGKAEHAFEISKKIFQHGFYASAVFFPIVKRGHAGLRIMGRADIEKSDIFSLCKILKESIAEVSAFDHNFERAI